MKTIYRGLFFACALLMTLSGTAWAMHISEGILPGNWAAFWFLAVAPFLGWGILTITRRKKSDPSYIPLLGMLGAAVFVFSCFPIPVPVAGSTSHPAGTGMSAIFLGPAASVVLAFISLLLQALFLAHGGLTTLGANTFSMGVLGSFSGYLVFQSGRACGIGLFWSAFVAGVAADLATYLGTALALALSLHGNQPFWRVLGQIYVAFMPTQIPLSLLEGAVTGWMVLTVRSHRPDILSRLGVLKGGEA